MIMIMMIIMIKILITAIIIACYLVVEAALILSLYILRVMEGDKKGQSDGFGKPFVSILSYENTRHRGGGKSYVSSNPNHLVLATRL